jgi:shikimate dehydrogenase
MLLHQAVRGFERWFGIKPEVTPELRALVEADLGATKPAIPAAAQEKAKPQAKRARGNKERG